MSKLRILDLFSGIGGFSLGLERTGGFETVAFCEIEEFPRKVLAKHWPGVPCYHDVRELTAARLAADGIHGIDVITGGFPCQDISTAGKQAGIKEGTRSGLWSEIIRLAGELRPQFIIVENVANLLRGPSEKPGAWFGRVLGDLASLGYDAEWHCIPASAVGAPHRRDRIWIVAYAAGGRLQGSRGPSCCGQSAGTRVLSQFAGNGYGSSLRTLADANCKGLQRRTQAGDVGSLWTRINEQLAGCSDSIGAAWSVEPNVGRVAHGVPNRAHRLKALGNAVVPAIPELIGYAILDAIQSAKVAA